MKMTITDKKRLDFLEKLVLSSGYSTEFIMGNNKPFERIEIHTLVGSGPFQEDFKGFSLRETIDKIIKWEEEKEYYGIK